MITVLDIILRRFTDKYDTVILVGTPRGSVRFMAFTSTEDLPINVGKKGFPIITNRPAEHFLGIDDRFDDCFDEMVNVRGEIP